MNKRKRLIWYLYPSYLIITIISIVAVTWYSSSALKSFFLEQAKINLQARAYLIAPQIKACFLQSSDMPDMIDEEKIDSICKKSGELSFTRITVILISGKVIGDSNKEPDIMANHYNRAEILSALKGGVGSSIRYSNTLKQNMMYVAIPLTYKEEIIAVLRTSIPITSIDYKIESIRSQIAFGSILIALFAALISLAVSRKITKPMEQMKKSAKRFAKGDLKHKLIVPDSEEMAGLAESMNQMAKQLDERIKTIIQQRNELEAVLSSMKESVIALDMDEKILSINQAAIKLFSFQNSNLNGKSIQEIIRNHELQKFVKQSAHLNKSLETDIVLSLPNYEEKVVNTRTTLLLDASNLRIGTLIIINDVTQLRRLETIRRDFVANVSHELKTPLTAIKGFVETLLLNSSITQEESTKFLGIIKKNVNRLINIIEDLMHLSKLEQADEQKERIFDKNSLLDSVEAAIQICRFKIDEKNIVINCEIDKELKVFIDAHLMEQAFVNLIDNAVKYSDANKNINIKAHKDNSHVIIEFQDQGCGIAKQHLDRLFERFYRVDKARTRKLGGTGLGLAIVKHIVQLHKGTINVSSIPGKGSTFSISLPELI